jgi:phosphoglycolate phosphatase-like HAD superfamily hydrolase
MIMYSRNILIFDCDGVILNSNQLKTKAYAHISQDLPKSLQKKYLTYHKRSGGISRREQVEVLIRDYLRIEDGIDAEINTRLKMFNAFIKSNAHKIKTVSGIRTFLKKAHLDNDLFVVTGGDEKEVKFLLKELDLHQYFKGIYGSPHKKVDLVGKIMKKAHSRKSVFFGDALHDFEVANKYKIPFYFVYGHTDMKDWKSFMKSKKVLCIRNFVRFTVDDK